MMDLWIEALRVDHLATCTHCKEIGSDCFQRLARTIVGHRPRRIHARRALAEVRRGLLESQRRLLLLHNHAYAQNYMHDGWAVCGCTAARLLRAVARALEECVDSGAAGGRGQRSSTPR